MGKIFKVLWNAATGTLFVTSETAKPRQKKRPQRKWQFPHSSVLSSIMVSADALANAGNDTSDGVTPTVPRLEERVDCNWYRCHSQYHTNVDGASAAMGYKTRDGKWAAIGSTASPPATLR